MARLLGGWVKSGKMDSCPDYLMLKKVNVMGIKNGTKLILHSGQFVSAADLKVGDVLMGPDSKPRTILELRHYSAPTFRVKPTQGRGTSIYADLSQPIVMRKSLYLINQKDCRRADGHPMMYRHFPDTIRATVADIFENGTKTFHRLWFLTKVKIHFPARPVPIDPYFLGIWLGDGLRHRPGITAMDKEIIDEVYHQANLHGLKVTINWKKNSKAATYNIVRGNVAGFGRHKNPLKNKFKEMNLIKNKHVPELYLYNSEEVRIQVLAGFIDTDGSLVTNVYSAFQVRYKIAAGILQIANSLGLRSYITYVEKKITSSGFKDIYAKIVMCGDVHRVPVRLSRKKATEQSDRYDRKLISFKVTPTGHTEELVSIRTDGDNFFLLDDCTVLSGDQDCRAISSYGMTEKDRNWDEHLSKVILFIEKHGVAPINWRAAKDKDELNLCYWLANVRSRILIKKISDQRIEKLTANPVLKNWYASIRPGKKKKRLSPRHE